MKNIALVVLILMISASAGCTVARSGRSASSASLEREVEELRAEVAALKSGQGSVSGSEISELRAEVRRLSASVDPDSSGGLDLAQVNARLNNLEKAAGLSQPAVSSAPGGSWRSDYQNVPSPAPAVSGRTGGGLFEEGKSLFDQKDYQGAVTRFKKYLAEEPKGEQADAAQFYIAESLYARQKYEEAILEYQKVIQGFPKSSQVPTSLLRQGIAFQSIGDKNSAKLLYQKVQRDYPRSYAADVAKGRLKNI